MIYDVNEAAVEQVDERRAAVPRARRRRRCSRAAWPRGGSARPPTAGVATGRERRRRHRHPGRRAPQPRPARHPQGAGGRRQYLRDGPARWCCAAPSTRASPGASSSCSPTPASTVDVAFCPERIAEGKAMTELFDLPQIVSGRTTASATGPRRCSGTSPTASSSWSRRRPSWPSCSRTPGATSSSPRPTSST